jgi:diguanylate cyclase (GGDEF)-like protein
VKQPISISHLGLALVGIALLAILAIGALMSIQLDRLASDIEARERASARREVEEALASLDKNLADTALALARWDETKQQLVMPEYYSLWRDLRVRDAGMISARVASVALYDKKGQILGAPRGIAMPEKLPFPVPRLSVGRDADDRHVLVFFPIHADPGGGILLGHGALKVDYLAALRDSYTFRHAAPDSLRLGFGQGAAGAARGLVTRLDYTVPKNRELESIKEIARVTFLRLIAVLFVLLMLGAWFFRHALVDPLRRISQDIDRLKQAPGDARPAAPLGPPMRILELENVRRSFGDYHEKLALLRQDLEKSSRDFFDQARHDALTGAFNRRAFDEDWRSLADSGYLGKCALLLFDCDHFKAINDSYGHTVGDQVIHAIAEGLMEAIRTGDRLYRLGGDEFATLLPNTDEFSAETVAERCLHRIQSHDFRQYGMNEPVSISIGIALSEHAAFNLHELHTQADLAMYSAKRPGSRKIVFYSEGLERISGVLSNPRVNAVYNAIQDPGLIELHYQPIVALPDATPAYSEALARLRHEGGLLMPGEFFNIVQAHRLDVEFDLAVLRSLAGDLRAGRLGAATGLSINISPPGIIDDGVLQELLDLKRREPTRKIVVEITENALITQMDKASDNIARLREVGCLVALDDFGSGYSSLRYLASMPVDMVKFDISMIRLLADDDPRQRLMVGEIANIVSANGYQTVAEGVETEEHMARVVALGFDYAQGYLFGR